ncbi:MAG: hypothetical protein C0582_03975 [Alphaproteobacteria bacterium]|nr:MAG: hypothetical protein C0582_03975 [Alphaproteobacteria bacterium]
MLFNYHSLKLDLSKLSTPDEDFKKTIQQAHEDLKWIQNYIHRRDQALAEAQRQVEDLKVKNKFSSVLGELKSRAFEKEKALLQEQTELQEQEMKRQRDLAQDRYDSDNIFARAVQMFSENGGDTNSLRSALWPFVEETMKNIYGATFNKLNPGAKDDYVSGILTAHIPATLGQVNGTSIALQLARGNALLQKRSAPEEGSRSAGSHLSGGDSDVFDLSGTPSHITESHGQETSAPDLTGAAGAPAVKISAPTSSFAPSSVFDLGEDESSSSSSRHSKGFVKSRRASSNPADNISTFDLVSDSYGSLDELNSPPPAHLELQKQVTRTFISEEEERQELEKDALKRFGASFKTPAKLKRTPHPAPQTSPQSQRKYSSSATE